MESVSHSHRLHILSSASSLLIFAIFPSSPFFMCPPSPTFPPCLVGLGQLTLFKCTFMLPFASIEAVSPRNDTTLPRMRTVWLMKESRYLALMRGVASEAMVEGLRGRRIGRVATLWVYFRMLVSRGMERWTCDDD